MNSRQKSKQLKQVAEQKAQHMAGFGYSTKVLKMLNGNDYFVIAENKYEKITIFVDRLQGPFNQSLIKKPGVIKF